jgi:LDH2 family malate/lactate/ureidoglycolate dehydrogenase
VLIQAEQLGSLLTQILAAAGTPPDIAGYVSASLVDSNLKGVDSHGAMRVSLYVDQITSGWINPAARPEILRETENIALVDANKGFGIFALGYAVDLAVHKARKGQVAAVGLVNCTHTGRLGQFVESAAERGVVAIITGGGHKGPGRSVAPHGGRGRIMATNPYSIGLPGGRLDPVVVDISTSISAEGKLQVYRVEGKELPAGWILNKDGRPSTNVEDFYSGGALLPAAGHKGYGLALAAEILGGALLGKAHELNWLVLGIDVPSFRPLDEYEADCEAFLAELKSVPPAQGFREVMIPGEPERRTQVERAANGIEVPDAVWQQIIATARRLGVEKGPTPSDS